LQRDELDGWKSNWGKSRKEEHFALCPQAGTSPQMRQQQTGTQLTELLLGVYLKTIQEVPFCQHMTSLAFVLPFSLSVEWKADESWREYRGKFVLEF
jgi:hypothetical protein